MDALSFIESPPKNIEHGVAVIYGEEGFLRHRALERVRRLVLGEGDEFGLARLDGLAAQLAEVLDELRTPPLFGKRRLVVVDEADEFVSRYRQSLEQYAHACSRWGVLVLMVKSWPSNTRLAKIVDKEGLPLDCRPPRPHEISRWLTRWCPRTYGKKLAKGVADRLVEHVGANLGVLDRELDKLASAAVHSDHVSEADVERLAASAVERTTWQMLDALAEGRSGEALKVLDALLIGGEQPVAILGAMSWHLRMLARAGRLIQSGLPMNTALQEAGVKPFAMQRAGGHLRRLGPQKTHHLYHWLLDADLDLKGRRPLPPQIVLETLIARLTQA